MLKEQPITNMVHACSFLWIFVIDLWWKHTYILLQSILFSNKSIRCDRRRTKAVETWRTPLTKWIAITLSAFLPSSQDLAPIIFARPGFLLTYLLYLSLQSINHQTWCRRSEEAGWAGSRFWRKFPKYPILDSNVRGKLICTESRIKSCAVWRSNEFLGISGIV